MMIMTTTTTARAILYPKTESALEAEHVQKTEALSSIYNSFMISLQFLLLPFQYIACTVEVVVHGIALVVVVVVVVVIIIILDFRHGLLLF